MSFSSGDHLIVSDDLYGGTYRIFERNFRQFGLAVTYADTSHPTAVQDAVIPGKTRALFIETPTNPLMKITDLEEIVRLARSNGLLTIVDNTFMTPFLQRPLAFGVDAVVHSGTKYLGGHNDLLAGTVVTHSAELSEKLGFIQNSTGAVLGPQDSWLMLRGLKTLALRVERQQENAQKIAEWLTRHDKVKEVCYPGLPAHPGHHIQQKQSSGFGAMLSFRAPDAFWAERVINRVKVITFAESLGGVESLITYPVRQTHGDIPVEIRDRIGVTDDLLRLSVGIEHVDDLIQDLEQALQEKTEVIRQNTE